MQVEDEKVGMFGFEIQLKPTIYFPRELFSQFLPQKNVFIGVRLIKRMAYFIVDFKIQLAHVLAC